MLKNIIRSTAVILIICVVCGTFFIIRHFSEYYDKQSYPKKYENIVTQVSLDYNVPEHIIYAVIKTESGFRENAVSSKGAVGLMQITPDTFEWLKTKTGEEIKAEMLLNPEVNIKYGVLFLGMLYEQFGNWKTAWAAYNAGRSRVMGWLQEQNNNDNSKNELTTIPFQETKKYVERVEVTSNKYYNIYYEQ